MIRVIQGCLQIQAHSSSRCDKTIQVDVEIACDSVSLKFQLHSGFTFSLVITGTILGYSKVAIYIFCYA
jgi:hypothetical protein